MFPDHVPKDNHPDEYNETDDANWVPDESAAYDDWKDEIHLARLVKDLNKQNVHYLRVKRTSIYNSDEKFYGKPNTPRRKQFQKKFYNLIQRWNLEKYWTFCIDNDISPCKFVTDLYKQSLKKNIVASSSDNGVRNTSAAAAVCNTSPTVAVPNTSAAAAVPNTAALVGTAPSGNTAPQTATSMMNNLASQFEAAVNINESTSEDVGEQLPDEGAVGSIMGSPTPSISSMRTPARNMAGMSPYGMMSPSLSLAPTSTLVDLLKASDGSKFMPHLQFVHLDRASKNRDFQVVAIDDKECHRGNSTCQAYLIRKSVSVNSLGNYCAYVPKTKDLSPTLQPYIGRSVLICKSGGDVWFDNTDNYCKGMKGGCHQTFKALKAEAMKDVNFSKDIWWLLIWPEEDENGRRIQLDNEVFSKINQVKRMGFELSARYTPKGSHKESTVTTGVVQWFIAREGTANLLVDDANDDGY